MTRGRDTGRERDEIGKQQRSQGAQGKTGVLRGVESQSNGLSRGGRDLFDAVQECRKGLKLFLVQIPPVYLFTVLICYYDNDNNDGDDKLRQTLAESLGRKVTFRCT